MGWHGSGWRAYIGYDEQQDRPEISLKLLRRVALTVRPYWKRAALLVLTITIASLRGSSRRGSGFAVTSKADRPLDIPSPKSKI